MLHHDLSCTCSVAYAESCALDKGAANCASFSVTNYGLGNGNDGRFKFLVYWPLYILLKSITTGWLKQFVLFNRDITHQKVWEATQGNGTLTKIIHVSRMWTIVTAAIREEISDSKDSPSYWDGPAMTVPSILSKMKMLRNKCKTFFGRRQRNRFSND
jgi:hypothetical protein